MSNPAENFRRDLTDYINSKALSREALEKEYGKVWDTKELLEDFHVKSFLAPFVFVTRKSDGVEGTLAFQNSPRFYWGWNPVK